MTRLAVSDYSRKKSGNDGLWRLPRVELKVVPDRSVDSFESSLRKLD